MDENSREQDSVWFSRSGLHNRLTRKVNKCIEGKQDRRIQGVRQQVADTLSDDSTCQKKTEIKNDEIAFEASFPR